MRPENTTGCATLVTLMLCVALAAAGCGKSAAQKSAESQIKPRPVASPVTTITASPPSAPSGAPPRTPVPAATVAPTSRISLAPRPTIIQSPIPFGPRRKAEMVDYARRHYGLDTYRLIDPHVIVIHYTETPDFQSTFNVFAPDLPDSELHELPGTCAHFVIDSDGAIHQLVSLGVMCRHTVGLNWTAIGVEHVGYSDGEVL